MLSISEMKSGVYMIFTTFILNIVLPFHILAASLTSAGSQKSISEGQAAGFFWKMMEMNAFPALIWESNGKVVYPNDAFLKLIGYTRKEFDEGKINWVAITPKEYLPLDEKCIEQLKSRTIAAPYEKKYIKKDGSAVRVRLYNATAHPGDVQSIGVVFPIDK